MMRIAFYCGADVVSLGAMQDSESNAAQQLPLISEPEGNAHYAGVRPFLKVVNRSFCLS